MAPDIPGAPTTDLRTQLQSAVGNTTETALDRPVVLKLLPTELASGVSAERH